MRRSRTQHDHRDTTVALRAPTMVAACPPIAEQDVASSSAIDRTGSIESTVYMESARPLLPLWRSVLERCGRSSSVRMTPPPPAPDAALQVTRQAAALACGAMSLETDNQRDREGLTDLVRIALIGWQRTLRCDGVPVAGRLQRSPHLGAAPWYVVQLLTESSSFQTPLLLTDLDLHLQWLSRTDAQSPWSEAMLIDALVEGALIVRRSELLDVARQRLSVLVERQHAEGWFPERGGADVGRLSLTVDALARLFRLGTWDQLAEPLQRACRFLVGVIHPNGSTGGCISSCGTQFISPYGVERLAQVFPEALQLAHVGRRRFRDVTRVPIAQDHAMEAVYGAALCMTASHAARHLPPAPELPTVEVRQTHFSGAGLVVHATEEYHVVVNLRTGGAMHVRWRDGSSLEDRGLVVVYPHSLRTSAHHDQDARPSLTGDSITCRGRLKRMPPKIAGVLGWWRRMVRAWLRIVARLKQVAKPNGAADRSQERTPRNWFERCITFGADRIRIHDHVRCRHSCETVICQPAGGHFPRFLLGGSGADAVAQAPRYIDGGRDVEIIRVYRNGELIDSPVDAADPNPTSIRLPHG